MAAHAWRPDATKLASPWRGWDPRLPLEEFHQRQVTAEGLHPAPGVPAGYAFFQKDVWGSGAESATNVKAPAPTETAASRRSARRAREDADSKAAAAKPAVAVSLDGQVGEAVWNARKARVIGLLGDESATPAELKRELRRTLAYADSARSAARRERESFAHEVQQLIAPLSREMGRMAARLRLHEGDEAMPDAKGADDADLVEVEDEAQDVLRAGKPGPQIVTSSASERAASSSRADAPHFDGELPEAGAGMSRRDRVATRRKVDAAAATAAAGRGVETLLFQLEVGGFAAERAAVALDQLYLTLGVQATPLKRAVGEKRGEARLLALLSTADKMPSTLHLAVLNALETHVEGYPAGCVGVRNAGGAATANSLLGAWSTRGSAGAPLLPHLLLFILSLAEGSEDAKAALVRAGCVETLVTMLDGDAASEATILSVEALKVLGVSRINLLCADAPHRLATLRAVWAMDKLFTPVAHSRRHAERHRRPEAAADGEGDGQGGSLVQALRRKQREHGAAAADEGGSAIERARRRLRERSASPERPQPHEQRARSLADANALAIRCRGDGLKKFDFFGGKSDPFLVVSVERDDGSFVELGRTEALVDASNPLWEEMRLELLAEKMPSERVYLRLAVFDWQRSGRHRLIGQTGGALDFLQEEMRLGRGLCLPLTMAGGVPGRGGVWIERCELVV